MGENWPTAEYVPTKMRAIDIMPYRTAIWCSVAGGPPFWNEFVAKCWSADGERIWFMLESHNFDSFLPSEEVEIGLQTEASLNPHQLKTKHPEWEAAAFLEKRPIRLSVLLTEAREAKEVLAKVEWSGPASPESWARCVGICPCCRKYQHQGHATDCRLARLLKEGE